MAANRCKQKITGYPDFCPSYAERPTHTAWIVIDPPPGSNRKAYWHEVGAIWPHKNGGGFDLVTPPGLSVSGRIVCTVRKDDDKAPEPPPHE